MGSEFSKELTYDNIKKNQKEIFKKVKNDQNYFD